MRGPRRWRHGLASVLGIGLLATLWLASASCKKKADVIPPAVSDAAPGSGTTDIEREAGPMPEWDHPQPLRRGTSNETPSGEDSGERSPSKEVLEIGRSAQALFALGDCHGAVLTVEKLPDDAGPGSVVQEILFPAILCYLGGPDDLRNRDRAVELLQKVQSLDAESIPGRKASLLLTLVLRSTELEYSARSRQDRIRELEREVRALGEELKGLKEIDLRRRRPPG